MQYLDHRLLHQEPEPQPEPPSDATASPRAATELARRLPVLTPYARDATAGRVVLAQHTADAVLVYAAFDPSIVRYATVRQSFTGAEGADLLVPWAPERMSWIKTNFLWMQYRSGWGTKPKQEGMVGLWLKRSLFDEILLNSVGAVRYSRVQTDEQHALRKAEAKADPTGRIVMQWDPDHLPDGSVVSHRRAVQLGLKGGWRDRVFDNSQGELLGVVDLTELVARLRPAAEAGADAWEQDLEVPRESVYPLPVDICDHIGAGPSPGALKMKKIRPSWTVSPLLTEARTLLVLELLPDAMEARLVAM